MRGNFVFLMGGHVEDEEEEAEQSHEIQEGRLENTARREIWRAVAHMTSTEQALAAHDTGAALAAAMKAVEALQKAFTRNRYILRTLPSRLRIDPSRRLSGALDDVKDETRAMASPAESPDAELSRRLLAEMIALIPPATFREGTRGGGRSALGRGRARRWPPVPVIRSGRESRNRCCGFATAVSGGAAAQPRIDAESRIVVQALLQRVRKDAAIVQPRSADRLERAWADEARRPMTILRLLAVIVAIAARDRSSLSVATPRAGSSAAARLKTATRMHPPPPRQLRAALSGRVDFVDSGAAVASVVIGGAGADAAVAGQGPVSVVSLDEPPSVAIVHAPSTISLMPGSAVDIPATLQAVGLAGRTSVVVLEQDGVELTRVEHAWKSDGSTTVQLPYIAPLPGARRLTVRVEAAVGEKRLRDNRADVLAMATARQARIAVVEARPSWSAAFARRALEADPAVDVSSVLRTSRGITSRAGEPPSRRAGRAVVRASMW